MPDPQKRRFHPAGRAFSPTRLSSLKNGDGVHGRGCPSEEPQGRDCQEELPALVAGAGVGEVIEARVIDQVEAHSRNTDEVIREGAGLVAGGDDVADPVAAEDGDASLMEPGEAAAVEPGDAR